nr:reverse transcriptase domain-containing protein [Tanacetum cinerariifolium]
ELKCKALADLGASINLMPLSVWKKLGFPNLIPTRMTLELANRAICTPDEITRDVFVPVGKFTFSADFVIVDYKSDPRVPLILGRPFLRTARALIDVHGEEMILRDGDERLTLNMKHDTTSYSNHPYRESVNLINIFNLSSEDCLEDLILNKQSGDPTFLLHKEIASPKVIYEIHDSKGCNFLSEELPDIDSFNDFHSHFDDDPLSGSTTFLANSLLEEFVDELALISYPLDYDDNRTCDIESDMREIEFLLYQGKDSDFKDSIDQSVLTHCDDLFVDPTPEMFTDEQPLDYSFPPRFDVDDVLPSPDKEDKVFNLGILSHEKSVKIITRVTQEKKLAVSFASWLFEDFDPPFSELLVFKEKKLSLPDLTPTRMTLELADRSITHLKGVAEDVFVKVGKFHFPADFVVVDFKADPRVPLILGRSFLRTDRALIDVYREEITLRVNDEDVTFNLNQTTRYSSTYDDLLVNQIDIIDVAREEYAQEIISFSSHSLGCSPTSTYKLILFDSSPSLTPFEGSDFILEEIDAYLKDESISPEIDHADCDPEGDICLIKKLLNNDPFQLFLVDLKEVIQAKFSIEEPPEVELKDLPSYLEYAYLEENDNNGK